MVGASSFQLQDMVAPSWDCLSLPPRLSQACKERKRERERERERKTGKGREEPARAERGRKKERRTMRHVQHGPACHPGVVVLPAHKKGEEKRTRAGPKRRKGEDEGGRREKKENGTRNSGPGVPRTARQKNSRNQMNKSIQKRTPGTSGNTSNTTPGVHCPKPSAKNTP